MMIIVWHFMFLSTLLKPYQDDGRMIMKLDKVPNAYTPDQCYRHFFKEHKVCSFDSGDGSCMLYVITLKEFNHTYNVSP